MQSPFIHGSKASLKYWKDLRQSLSGEMDDIAQLKSVVSYWSKAPITIRSINWDHPGEWPDPWQLIFDGDFDESAVAIGMFYTLLLSQDGRWTPNRLNLSLILDKDRQIQRLILEVDHRWLLNLDYNLVVDGSNVERTFFVQQSYAYNEKNGFGIMLPKNHGNFLNERS
jgi:hypothetical protein